jgi:hypothetical protein
MRKNLIFMHSLISAAFPPVPIPQHPGNQRLRTTILMVIASTASWGISAQTWTWKGVRKALQALIDRYWEIVKLVDLARILWFV